MSPTLYGTCTAAYAALAVFLLLRTRANPSRLQLLAASVLTALWAGATVALPPANPLLGVSGLLDLLRLGAWYIVTLHFYRRLPAAS